MQATMSTHPESDQIDQATNGKHEEHVAFSLPTRDDSTDATAALKAVDESHVEEQNQSGGGTAAAASALDDDDFTIQEDDGGDEIDVDKSSAGGGCHDDDLSNVEYLRRYNMPNTINHILTRCLATQPKDPLSFMEGEFRHLRTK